MNNIQRALTIDGAEWAVGNYIEQWCHENNALQPCIAFTKVTSDGDRRTAIESLLPILPKTLGKWMPYEYYQDGEYTHAYEGDIIRVGTIDYIITSNHDTGYHAEPWEISYDGTPDYYLEDVEPISVSYAVNNGTRIGTIHDGLLSPPPTHTDGVLRRKAAMERNIDRLVRNINSLNQDLIAIREENTNDE